MKDLNKEKQFYDSLYEVYVTQDEQSVPFKAVRIRDNEDNEEVRIYIAYDCKVVRVLQTPMSRLIDRIKEVINHGVIISHVDRANLLRNVEMAYGQIPVIDKIAGLGWQYDAAENVIGFACSEFISIDGNVKVSDIEAGLPTKKGTSDISTINTYMNKNIVREIVMLYNLTAPIAGILKCVFILSLNSKSSTGKTTLAKMAASQTSSPEYEGLCKNLNTTDNASEKGLEGINGLGVLLDDTSLTSRNFDWDRFIYRLSTGKSKERLNRECQISDTKRFYSTIVITTEHSILSKVDPDREGNNGRIIEIPVGEGVAFDDDIECRNMELYFGKNHGITLPSLIKKIMDLGCESVSDMVHREELELRKAYLTQEVVVKRHFIELAALCVTARLANQYLGYQFHVENITEFLIENIRESLIETREMQSDNVVMEKIYPEMLEVAKINGFKQKNGVNYYPLRNECLKACVKKNIKNMTLKQVKQILWENGVLYKNGTDFSNPETVDGKQCRCLLITEKEDN